MKRRHPPKAQPAETAEAAPKTGRRAAIPGNCVLSEYVHAAVPTITKPMAKVMRAIPSRQRILGARILAKAPKANSQARRGEEKKAHG
jgi:hypothetical protein